MFLRDVMRRLMAPEGGDGAAAGAGGGSASGAGSSGAGDKGGGDKGGAADGKAAAGAGGDDKKSVMGDSAAAGKGDGAAGADGKGAAAGDGKALTDEEKALAAAEKDSRRPAHVPAKYWDHTKGEVRAEAAFKSLAELEGRMRSTGLPPKEAGEYKVEIPKALTDAGFGLSEAQAKEFRELAHTSGLTQKQFEGVMGAYFKNIESMAVQTLNIGKDKLGKDLLAFYKTPEAVKEHVSLALRTVQAYGDEAEQAEALGAGGNVPRWVYSVLAKVGKELGEDPGVQPDEILAGDSLEHLMRGAPGKEDAPYWNAEHPKHKETVAKVTAFHQAKALQSQRQAAATTARTA